MKVRKKKQMLWRLFLMLLCCGAVLMGTTYAWRSISQRTVNEFVEEPDTVPVELWKCVKLADGTLTDTPLSGVAFYLYRQDGIRIGGIYTTDELGKISTWLPKGDYYFEEIASGDGYDYDVDEEGVAVKHYPFTVTGEEEESVEVLVYNVPRTGSLMIRKWVRNADDTELTEGQLVQEDAEGWNYDGSIYTLLIKVYEEENGNLAALQVLLKDGQQANVIRFENHYQEEKPDDEVQLPNNPDTPEKPSVEEPDTTDIGEGADIAKPTIYGPARTGDTTGYARYLWLLLGSVLVFLLFIYWRSHKGSLR